MRDGELDHFHLTLLGSWQIVRGGANFHVPLRQQRLITALAIYGARPRSYLRGLLWPDSPEARAKESLRVSVHLISHQIPGLLVNGGPRLSLCEPLTVDLNQLRDRMEVLIGCRSSDLRPSDLVALRNAELLPGWYEDWILFEQSRLCHARLHAFHAIAGEALASCNYDVAVEAAEAALELEPLYESALQVLILALRKQGNNAYALQVFKKYETQLNEDVRIAPSEAIRALVADIA